MTQYSVFLLPMIALAMVIFFPHTSKNSKVSTSWKSRRKRKVFLWRLTLAVLLISTVVTLAWRWEGYVITLTQGVMMSAAILVPALVLNALVSLIYRNHRTNLISSGDARSPDLEHGDATAKDEKLRASRLLEPANPSTPKSSISADSAANTDGRKATAAADHPQTIGAVASSGFAATKAAPTNTETMGVTATKVAPTNGKATGVTATKVAPTNGEAKGVTATKVAPTHSAASAATNKAHEAKVAHEIKAQNDKKNTLSELKNDDKPEATAKPAAAPEGQQRIKRKRVASANTAKSLHEATSLNPDFDNVEITLFEDEESPAQVQEQLSRLSGAVQSHDLSDWKETLTRDNSNWKDIRESHDRQTALSTDLITSVSSTTDISKLDAQEINQLVTTLTKDKLRLQKLVIAQQAAIESERQSHDQSRTVARDAIKIMRDARVAQKTAEKLARRERTERKRIEQQYKSVANALDNALSIIETRKQQSQVDSA